MSPPSPRDETLPRGVAARLDPVCDRFEADWLAGRRPPLEDFLASVAEADREPLLRELLALELDYRTRRGERPAADDYRSRFPRHAAIVAEVFAAFAARPPRPTREAPQPPLDSVDTLLDSLHESGLLSASQREECRAAKARFPDTKALARHLLQRDWMTPFQVNYVLQGKAGDLFLDNYVLMERIGQGGMGQVFRAKHRIMDRLVALKIIRPERLANPELVKRFRREIKLAAQLAHPNIVIAYDAAEQNGTHFLVMEFVEGIDLARHVEKNGRRPVPQACEWVRQVALGLQHAHERGMVHRDIKPANLLLAVKENVVKVLDMGLARISHGSDVEQTAAGLTQEGAVMGTPDYMAPEQAEESAGVDIRADIYSLGCTLYFLLAGRVPFPGGTLAQKLRKHAQAEAEPLAAQRTDVPAGLTAIVRKMMAKRPEDRYQTPGEVAAALEPFCKAGPVAAVPVTAGAAGARPVAVPLSLESIAALATTPPVAVVAAASPSAGETVPPSVLDSVPSVTLPKAHGPLAGARRAWRRLGRRGQVIAAGGAAAVLLALLIVLFTGKKPPPPARPPSVLDPLDAAKIPPEDRPAWQSEELKKIVVAVLGEHRVRISSFGCMAISPDRKTVAVADGNVVRLVDTRTLRERYALAGHNGIVRCVAFSDDGQFVASGGDDQAVRLWKVADGSLVRLFGSAHNGVVRAVALTPHGEKVLSGGDDGLIYVRDAQGEQREKFTGHTTPVRALVVAKAPDGRLLAYSAGSGAVPVGKSADRDVRIWEVATCLPDKDRLLTGHQGSITRLEISPDGKRLLAATDSSQLAVWDVGAGDPKVHILRALEAINDNVATDGTFVGDDQIVTCAANIIRPWAPGGQRGYQQRDPIPLPPPAPSATAVAWLRAVPRENRDGSPTDDGLLFVSDGTLRVWNLGSKKEWRPPIGHTRPAVGLTFLGKGERLVSFGQDQTVRTWDLTDLYDPATGWPRESRPAIRVHDNGHNFVPAAPVSADGNVALTLRGYDPFVTVWEWKGKWNESNKLEWKDAPAGQSLTAVSLSDDGTRALIARTDKTLRLWDVARRVEVNKFEGLPSQCSVVRLLPEGHAYTWDGSELRLWEGWDDGGTPKAYIVPVRGSCAIAISPEREMGIVGEGDGHMVRMTDLARGKPLLLNLDWWQKGQIRTLALAPERNAFLAGSVGSAGEDKQPPGIGLWDLARDPIPNPQFWDLRGPPTALTFAPDGRHAAMANPDGTIYILRLPEGK